MFTSLKMRVKTDGVPRKLNKKIMAINALIAILVLTFFSQLVLLQVYAADVEITSISPQTRRGKVGGTVTLAGKINTTNGEYRVLLGNVQVAWGFASGNNVNCSFNVPVLPNGNYTLTLRDVTANINATSWFYIETGYLVKVDKPPYPRQFMEGETAINISISITGGKANTAYAANVTVKNPANETFWSLAHINTADNGKGDASLRYPEHFGGAHTNYTGIYKVYFNGTLASDTFFVGLTDQAEYHRVDTVKIKAVGYSPLTGANVTITVKLGNQTINSFNYTVLGDVIEANWTVPTNALIGNYSLGITPKPANKKVSDTQIFVVPGFKTEIVPRNLAGEPVSNVLVKIYDKWANTIYNFTSNENGVAVAWLEKGEYNSTAYFKKVRVCETSFNIPYGYDELNLTCQLSNLYITVVSEQNVAVKIPFVSLNLTVTYTTELNGGKVENETIISKTDIDGSARFSSLILNAAYKVTASRYGRIFNINNDTIAGLKSIGQNEVTILCPVKSLTVNVVDANNVPISNALVEIQEVMGGLREIRYTNSDGQSFFSCVFGIYNVKVSKGILLNVTEVELFEEKTVTIRCFLYNLPICVKVVDYFGQPVPNVNVTLERKGVQLDSKLTEANGMVAFTENGGTLTIKVYLADKNQPAYSFTCMVNGARDETNPIMVKLDRYVVFVGFLVETAWFATFILIVAVVVLFVLLEVARKKRLKIQGSKS